MEFRKKANNTVPLEIKLKKGSKVLEITFPEKTVCLSFEYLRVFSPSAEVQGHGPGQATLQYGKRLVDITNIEPVGNYAIKPVFSDGHHSGIFSWQYLYELGVNQEKNWRAYLKQLSDAGKSRDDLEHGEQSVSAGKSNVSQFKP